MSAHHALWIDAGAGVAGDMLLAALVDAGAAREVVAQAVASVAPEVRLGWESVSRNGFRALRAVVTAVDSPAREMRDILDVIAAAPLPPRVRELALAAFERLGRAEAHVHGVPFDRVHLHEVGAWDAIADIVGSCAALVDLDVATVTVGPIELGSGTVEAAHGTLPVPAPGVAELVRGWRVRSTRTGEAATPTGVALLATWCTAQSAGPTGRVLEVGVGAGSADPPGLANVVRAVRLEVGDDLGPGATESERLVELAANVDDLDPRAWPAVIDALLGAGALDAWLTPIVMKKGRPAHTVRALVTPDLHARAVGVLLRHTTSFGVRATNVTRWALERGWVDVSVLGAQLPVKIGMAGDRIVHATVEFEPAAALARELERPVHEVLDAARAAAVDAGLVCDAAVPESLRALPGVPSEG